MKQVWVKRSTCSRTPSTTCGAALPTPTTAIPEPRSISELPSTSTSTPPPARSTNTGRTVPTPRARDLGDEEAVLGERGAAGGESGGHGTLLRVTRCDGATLRPAAPKRQR